MTVFKRAVMAESRVSVLSRFLSGFLSGFRRTCTFALSVDDLVVQIFEYFQGQKFALFECVDGRQQLLSPCVDSALQPIYLVRSG